MISASGAYSEIGQPGARLVVAQMRQEQVPEAFRARLLLQILHEGNGILSGVHFLVPLMDARHDMRVHERAHLRAQRFDFRAIGKVHFALPSILVNVARRKRRWRAAPLIRSSAHRQRRCTRRWCSSPLRRRDTAPCRPSHAAPRVGAAESSSSSFRTWPGLRTALRRIWSR